MVELRLPAGFSSPPLFSEGDEEEAGLHSYLSAPRRSRRARLLRDGPRRRRPWRREDSLRAEAPIRRSNRSACLLPPSLQVRFWRLQIANADRHRAHRRPADLPAAQRAGERDLSGLGDWGPPSRRMCVKHVCYDRREARHGGCFRDHQISL